ncbi:transmembrane protein 88B isoform X2 [Cavia porcellus]|uniref:transmembrane protein 88B isoform X2 n=1 Tax=Cavia porcellus TaxID=10141 RepID=UPI002FE1012C
MVRDREGAHGWILPALYEAWGSMGTRWRWLLTAGQGLKVHPAPGPHCRALLSDRGSAALIVFGFLLLPPLLVVASAARAHLMRRLRPLLLPSARTPELHSNSEEHLCACV